MAKNRPPDNGDWIPQPFQRLTECLESPAGVHEPDEEMLCMYCDIPASYLGKDDRAWLDQVQDPSRAERTSEDEEYLDS